MQLTLLGTGTSQGVPIIVCDCEVCKSGDFRNYRLRTSALLRLNEKNILIDVGPDIRQQAIRCGINRIDAVILTHEHRDHTSGLDELRAYNYLQNSSIPIYAWPRVLSQIKKDYAYAFVKDPYPSIPRLDLIPITHTSQSIFGVEFTFLTAMHGLLPVMGIQTREVTYLTDVKTMTRSEQSRVKPDNILILNALQIEPHASHLTLAEALHLVADIAPRKTYLTHISHRLGLHANVAKALPSNVYLGFDGLTIEVS